MKSRKKRIEIHSLVIHAIYYGAVTLHNNNPVSFNSISVFAYYRLTESLEVENIF